MLVDIGEVKLYIKPKADSTLRNMRKDDLIVYIRTLEHNYNVAVSFNENQARYIESLDAVPVVRCKDCKHYKSFGPSLRGFESFGRCQLISMDVDMPVGGYCCYGERRADNGEM